MKEHIEPADIIRAVYVFLSAICFLLVSILFVLVTKDDWHLYGITELICIVALIAMFPISCKMSHHFGKMSVWNRPRERIESTYQTEPHGIRYSQKARERG